MGKHSDTISEPLQRFIARQKLFFVATAAAEGRVNVSPKGMDSLRVLAPSRVVWLNVTGSGNETAAHLLELNRITLMFCAFEGDPLILRLYGQAKVIHPRDVQWSELIELFPALPGARQLIDVTVELVQTSCGMAVPLFDFRDERSALNEWANKKGQAGIERYWQEKNQESLDGKPTEILG
jgi:Pyridoxamine 5'-phosphate oxidase